MSEFVNTVDLIGDEALTAKIIERSLTEIRDNNVTAIGKYAFSGCTALITADFPAVSKVEKDAFSGCSKMEQAIFPVLSNIGENAFKTCSKLTKVRFPLATQVQNSAFNSCGQMTTADFPVATSFGGSVFTSCNVLVALILRSETMASASGAVASWSSIASGTGYIYVPRALVDTYKAATNWSTYAAQFRALEDYTVDGTITGELDPTKI